MHVVTEGIALGGKYDVIRIWLHGVMGKSIVSHQSFTSQLLVCDWSETPNSDIIPHNFGSG
jgi:hypothetical protein